MRLTKPVGLLRDVFPADTVTRLTSGYVNPDPQLWPINQGKYYADLGFLCMREDEKLFLDAYLLARYAPQEPFGVLRHEEYFIDWDGTRAGGINTPLMKPDYVTKMQLWSVSGNEIIASYQEFARTAVCPPIAGMVSPKLNEVLAPSKATRLVVCLPGWFHYLEKRFFGPILEWHRTHPWEGAIRVGTSVEGDTHRIFARHATSTEVFECDITGLEFCYNQDYWDMLCRLRQRQSKYPRHIKALYDAARHAKLVFPDGTVCGETVAEKSGGQNTLCDNSIATEITFRRAHYNFCADRNIPYNADDMKLDIMGDNAMVSFYGPLTGKNIMFVFQVYFRLWGFHLKAKAAKANGAWGLVWCGWTKDGPGSWIRFEKHDKMLAKACFQSRTLDVAVQQLQACYRLLYNTPVLAEIQHAIKRVESLYKVSIKLPNWGHIQLSLAEFIPQCARFPDFYSRSDPAEHPVHNGAQAPPDKDSAMAKTKVVVVKKKKKHPKVEVVRIKPKLVKAKAKKRKGKKGKVMRDPITSAEEADSTQCMFQMFNADACYRRMVENDMFERSRFMVGPPVDTRPCSVNWVTSTKVILSSIAWTAATQEGSLRCWATPNPNGHVAYATAFDANGAITATASTNVQGYSTLAANYDVVACTGIVMVVKCLTAEMAKGGICTFTNYQAIGAGATAITSLTRSQLYNLDNYQWPPNSVEKGRSTFFSSDWAADYAFKSPTASADATTGCVIVQADSSTSSGLTVPTGQYEIIVYACWSGVPIASIFSAEAASGTQKPVPDCVSGPMVKSLASAALSKLPLYSTARCVAPDGNGTPQSWQDGAMGWYNETFANGRRAYDSFSKAFSGKGGVTGVFSNLWDGAKAAGSVISSIAGLFGDDEVLARMFLALDPKRRELLWEYARTHPHPPSTADCEAAINFAVWERKNAKPLPPAQVYICDDKKSADVDDASTSETNARWVNLRSLEPPTPGTRRALSQPPR